MNVTSVTNLSGIGRSTSTRIGYFLRLAEEANRAATKREAVFESHTDTQHRYYRLASKYQLVTKFFFFSYN